jgi:glycosidase
MADIFLSYARADVSITRRLAAVLEGLGWSVWWDTDLNAGDTWSSVIEAEARGAGCVVVLWSRISVQREWVLKEAAIGRQRDRLVPMALDRGLELPPDFGEVQTGSLATWDSTSWHPEFQRLVRALTPHLGDPPRPIPPHPPYSPYAEEILGRDRPASVAEIKPPPSASERYFPSPSDWKDEVLYLLIPDRFSDGCEEQRKLLDRTAIPPGASGSAGTAPLDAWTDSGLRRWQGGTLSGVTSKLAYLQGLGVTTIWLWPVFKQRVVGDTYHGDAPQDFLDVDLRLGTRKDLVELVAQAHHRKMRVILSGELHHSGTNWNYGEAAGDRPTMPYTVARHPFGSWLDADDRSVSMPKEPDDGIWPTELQEPDCYQRAGTGQLGPMDADWESPNAEFRRSDFFTLRTFDPARTLQTLISCHRYWIALTDCDGLYLDLAVHEQGNVLNEFCGAIREYAARLGKHDFLVLGEVYGSVQQLQSYYDLIGRTLHESLSAILDNGPMRLNLHAVAKGHMPAGEWFAGYGKHAGEMGMHRELGSRHVSILDDPDGVFGSKLRFAFDARDSQIVIALAIQLFSLGIPCIYYGTEQALGQRPPRRWYELEDWGTRDVHLREAMFGPEHPLLAGATARACEVPLRTTDPSLPGFGPLGTAGLHAFDDTNPLYQAIADLTSIRRNHATLRTGRQYQREISINGGPLEFPRAGELVAWSRILGDEEVLCVVNPNAVDTRSGRVVVDSRLNGEGTAFGVVLATGATEFAAAGTYRKGTPVKVLREGGVAYLDIAAIPSGGVVVLSNRAE